MNKPNFWSRLLPQRAARLGRARLRLQTVGLDDAQMRQLKPLCTRVGETLDLDVEVDTRQGDIVLAERAFARHTPPQQLARLVDARPLITCDLGASEALAVGALGVFERRQRELLAQLRELPMVRGLSPQFGASGWDPEVVSASFLPSGFDSSALGLDAPPLGPVQEMLVTWLLRGLMDTTMKPLSAAYGPGAVIRVDFAQGFALVDPGAQQALRVRRELPDLVVDGLVPGADAIGRELQELVWDIGIAAGQSRLLDQPVDWWHTPLATCADPEVQRFTRLPRYLELASILFRSRVTPAELQRRTGHAVAEMRPFLQACLFLGLAWWSPET